MRAVHGVAAVFLLVAAWAQAAELPGSFGHYTPARQFTEHVSSTLYLPMRDGVRLAVRVTRPARDGQAAPGRFPVLFRKIVQPLWLRPKPGCENPMNNTAKPRWRSAPKVTSRNP